MASRGGWAECFNCKGKKGCPRASKNSVRCTAFECSKKLTEKRKAKEQEQPEVAVPQQALESSRNAINDLAALPSAMSGMMGLNGVGMMGNALQGIGRGLQQDPVVAMGMS